MEGVHLLRDLMEQGDWLVKLDLKDAYLTINVAEKFRKFLRFFWKNKIWEFTCLPFGIAIAPRVFTKIMKIPIAILRRLGIRLVIYLDDILIMNQSLTDIISDLSTAVYLLENLGFLINQEKSVLVPSHITEFLGFTVNSETMTLSLPKDKVLKIKENCLDLVNRQPVSVRGLAQLIGRLTATNQAVLPSPLHYRSLQLFKNKGFTYGKQLRPLRTIRQEFETRTNMVVIQIKCMEWESFNSSPTKHHSQIGCKPDRLGCNLSKIENGRSLVGKRKESAYKRFRTKSCILSDSIFSDKNHKKARTATIGQQGNDSIYKQHGGLQNR